MKITELIQQLQELPENADVLIHLADYEEDPFIYMVGLEYRADDNEVVLF